MLLVIVHVPKDTFFTYDTIGDFYNGLLDKLNIKKKIFVLFLRY